MISNFLTFFESLKVILINMVAILINSAILATLGLLKIQQKFDHVTQVIF